MTDAALAAMTPARLIGAYLTDIRIECLRILRAPEFFIPVVLLPLGFYLLLGVAMHDMRTKAGAGSVSDVFVFLSFAVYGAGAVGLINIGMLVAIDRGQGLLTLKRALPMPAWSYIAAKIAMAVIFDLLILTLLIPLATRFGHVTLTGEHLAAVGSVMVAGIAPFAAIGLFLGAHLSVSAASACANILFVAAMSLGGLFYPLPPGLVALKAVWPTYHLHQLELAAAGFATEGSIAVHAGALVAVTVVFSALAVRRLARAG